MMVAKRTSSDSTSEPVYLQNYEDLISGFGLGRGQVVLLLIYTLTIFSSAPYLVSTTFLNAPTGYACIAASSDINKEIFYLKDSPFYNGTYYSNNCYLSADLFPDFQVTQSSPVVSDTDNEDYPSPTDSDTIEEKWQPPNGERNKEIPCVAWEFDTSEFTSTFTSEFNLVCGRQSLQPLFHVMYTSGYVIGDLFGGIMSDRYGRRKISFMGNAFAILSAFSLIFIHDLYLDLLLRFVTGFGNAFSFGPNLSNAMENIPSKYRTSMIIFIMGFAYFLGEFALCIISYFVREWRLVQIYLAAPLILFIPMFFLLDESPRWLAMQERYDEAITILEKVSRLNKAEMPNRSALLKTLINMKTLNPQTAVDVEIQKMPDGCSDGKKRSYFMVQMKMFFGSPTMIRIALVAPIIWFLQGLTYVGIPLNANNFSGSPFLYLAISSSAQLLCPIVGPPLTKRFGRIRILMFLFAGSGTCSLLRLAFPEEMAWLQLSFVMLGMAFIGTAYLITYYQVPELYPTCIRGQGCSICAFVGHTSYIVTPYITDVLSILNPIVPNVVFGVSGLVAAALLPLLPETNNLRLCETIEDVEKRAKGDW